MAMKTHILLFCLLGTVLSAGAQTDTSSDLDMDPHQIVIQLTSPDTNVHKMLVRQIGNILAAAPNSKVEVVCHAGGINMLMTQHSKVLGKINELNSKGVAFIACENTMKEKKIMKEEVIPEAGYVKAGILEIVIKQEQGWSYIRASQ